MDEALNDVIGIGNAIVDIIGRCDDNFLARHDAPKGHMRLVDADTISAIYDSMGPAVEVSGGSAANTMVAVASLGGAAAFIGKVADDEFGRIFAHDIRGAGLKFNGKPVGGQAPTSRSLILVTPDGERTMNTFLGISTDLDHGEVDADAIKSARILYLEGYLFDQPEAKAAFRQAVEIAKSANRKVALSLSDGFCVDRHRDEFLQLIKSGIDILFANESEIKSLYQTSDFDTAADCARKDAALCVLTRGPQGSVVISDGQAIEVPAEPIDELVDTTGAGDLYAAGFLYGVSAGHDLATSGRLGAIAAADIIQQIGARPAQPLRQVAMQKGIKFFD